MKNNGDFGRLILAVRTKMKCSREHFAELCGLSDKCISNVEHGKSDPRLSTVLKICRAANIDLGALSSIKEKTEEE